MLIPTSIRDILIIVDKLKNGVDVHKCKVDGKMVQIQSSKMQAEDSLTALQITCAYKDGDETIGLEAHHPIQGGQDVIKVSGADVEGPDIDIRLVPHLTYADVKVTLQFHKGDVAHTIELYGKIASVL